jgi:hypothetical protein
MGVSMATAGARVGKNADVEGEISFPQDLLSFIDEWKVKPGSLIMMLHKTQETFGYISRPAAEKLAKITGIPLARIYGVVTFYHFFKTTSRENIKFPCVWEPPVISRAVRTLLKRPGTF